MLLHVAKNKFPSAKKNCFEWKGGATKEVENLSSNKTERSAPSNFSFRVNEKVAVPTSVVYMAINTLMGEFKLNSKSNLLL